MSKDQSSEKLASSPMTLEEISDMFQYRANKMSIRQIAVKMNRNRNTIQARLKKPRDQLPIKVYSKIEIDPFILDKACRGLTENKSVAQVHAEICQRAKTRGSKGREFSKSTLLRRIHSEGNIKFGNKNKNNFLSNKIEKMNE